MANDLNQCNFIGRLGKDPESRAMPSGEQVANISIAVGWKGKDKEGVEWVPVVFFGRLAEVVIQYLKKGSKIQVTGRFRTQKFQDKEGKDRYKTEIVAHQMQMLDSKPADGEQAERPARTANKPAPAAAATAGAAEFDDDIPFAWTFAIPVAGLIAAAIFAADYASRWA